MPKVLLVVVDVMVDMLETAEDKWDIQIAVVDHDKDKVDMSLYEHTVSFTTLHHPLP